MISYEWYGAKYKKLTSSQNQSNTAGKNKAGGLIAGGGLIAATGRTSINSNTVSKGNVIEQEVEETGTVFVISFSSSWRL